jgi:ribosomal protein S18 acetylase RimI-like enzyme
VAQVRIRRGTRADIGPAADLIVRTKRLNNEFDPLFMVVEDSRERARRYIADSLKSPEVLLLVATRGEKLVGVLRAELRNRIFYHPTTGGHITDFYVLPEYRRKALGNDMLESAAVQLKRMGAEMITAEVPSQNEIAVNFYTKRGFRSLMHVFAGRSQ